MAQDDDLKLPLTATAGKSADDPAQEPIQQAHQHDAQSEPARPRSPSKAVPAESSFFTPQAYVAGVDGSTIYIGVLNEQYDRLLASGFSATETEYLRAREGGKRVAVYTAAEAPNREGHLQRFIERVRTFVRRRATAISPISTAAYAAACTNWPPRHYRHG